MVAAPLWLLSFLPHVQPQLCTSSLGKQPLTATNTQWKLTSCFALGNSSDIGLTAQEKPYTTQDFKANVRGKHLNIKLGR